MARLTWSMVGGGGNNTDMYDATPDHVEFGKVFGGGGSDEPQIGRMPVNGAITKTLKCGESYTIPEGKHPAGSKVTADSLSSQTAGTATAGDLLAGKSAFVNGSKIDGAMADRGAPAYTLPINGTQNLAAGRYTGGSVKQTIPVQGGSTTVPGTANKTIVAANRYVNGNVVVSGDPGLVGGNIKKNVTIFGVKGTWDGFVPGPYDIYKRGTFGAGYSLEQLKIHKSSFPTTINAEPSTIRFYTTTSTSEQSNIELAIILNVFFNFTAYSKISFTVSSVRGYTSGNNSSGPNVLNAYIISAGNTKLANIAYYPGSIEPSAEVTGFIDISKINTSGYLVIELGRMGQYGGLAQSRRTLEPYIHHIWLT